MNKRQFMVAACIQLVVTGCSAGPLDTAPGYLAGLPFVVEVKGTPDIKGEKLLGISHAGQQLFSKAGLSSRTDSVSIYLSDSRTRFPEWMDVSWREMPAPGAKDYTGKPVGPFRVSVLDRIPKEAIELARSRPGKNMLVLRFRIKEDGVLFGWMVRDEEYAPFRKLISGGDFT